MGFHLCIRRSVMLVVSAVVLGTCTDFVQSASADSYASAARTEAAKGHYARARTMLVEALAEFEQARQLARPDMLFDSEEWRTSIISRTEELNRVLDPQPRVSRHGVRFSANPLLVRREKERVPPVEEGAKLSNTFAEEKASRERDRARLVRETEPKGLYEPEAQAPVDTMSETIPAQTAGLSPAGLPPAEVHEPAAVGAAPDADLPVDASAEAKAVEVSEQPKEDPISVYIEKALKEKFEPEAKANKEPNIEAILGE